MADVAYAYSTRPTRNPLRYLLALWRAVKDPTNTHEVAIVEMGFARSRLGRRFARWELVVEALRGDPRTSPALAALRRCEPINLEALARLPEGTLGRVFFEHCRTRGIDPNLGYIAPGDEVDWLLHHTISTHDIWHVATGWGNDELGEYGLGAFYVAQLASPFFGFLLAIAMLSTIFRRRSLADFMAAIVAGYEMGKRAEPLFGVDWPALWATPLAEVRARFALGDERVLGEGIRSAA